MNSPRKSYDYWIKQIDQLKNIDQSNSYGFTSQLRVSTYMCENADITCEPQRFLIEN